MQTERVGAEPPTTVTALFFNIKATLLIGQQPPSLPLTASSQLLTFPDDVTGPQTKCLSNGGDRMDHRQNPSQQLSAAPEQTSRKDGGNI